MDFFIWFKFYFSTGIWFGLCWLKSYFVFCCNFCPIPALYTNCHDLYSDICVSSSTVPVTYVFGSPEFVSVRWPKVARALRDWGGKGEVVHTANVFTQVCVQNYSGSRFDVLIQGKILGPIPVPGLIEEWGDSFRGSSRSMTSRPRFISRKWPSHVRVKCVPRVLLPWVKSNLWVQQGPPSRA